MKMIVCLDDKNGMLFNHRRQSSDKEVSRRILELAAQRPVWMNRYSCKLFEGLIGAVCVDEHFLEQAGRQDWCFVEDLDVTPYISQVNEVVIFRWNRVYPADMYFPMHVLNGWTKTETMEFAGNSHDKITLEVYRR